VIATATNTVTATIPVGTNPYGVAVSPDGSTAYVTNASNNNVSVIATATNTVTATIPVGTSPEGIAAADVPLAAPAVAAVSPPHGSAAGGTTVTITGTAFTGATAVHFGTVPAASFTVNSATQVTATAPAAASAGTVDVTVTTPGGTSAVGPAGRYTYTLIPQAVSFAAPGAGTAGRQASLTAAGGGSGNPVVFTVDPSSGAGVCRVSGSHGSTVSYLAAGRCVIDANQAGNARYAPAPKVTAAIPVYQAPAFTTRTPPLTAAAGQPYRYTFHAAGTPAPRYALAPGAPAWLTVNPGTGVLAGTPPLGTPPAGAAAFTYTVTAANRAGTATAGPFTVTVASTADLSAALACPRAMTAGGTGTCTLTVANPGPATAASVAAAIHLPPGLSRKSCTPACEGHGNAIIWTLASLASRASAKFAVTVRAVTPGTATVTVRAAATALSPDPDPFNNNSVARITITRARH